MRVALDLLPCISYRVSQPRFPRGTRTRAPGQTTRLVQLRPWTRHVPANRPLDLDRETLPFRETSRQRQPRCRLDRVTLASVGRSPRSVRRAGRINASPVRRVPPCRSGWIQPPRSLRVFRYLRRSARHTWVAQRGHTRAAQRGRRPRAPAALGRSPPHSSAERLSISRSREVIRSSLPLCPTLGPSDLRPERAAPCAPPALRRARRERPRSRCSEQPPLRSSSRRTQRSARSRGEG